MSRVRALGLLACLAMGMAAQAAEGDTDYRHIGWPMETSPWAITNKTTLPPGSVLIDPRVVPVDSVLSLGTDVVGSML